jgi:small conductance mechanosensitive channel
MASQPGAQRNLRGTRLARVKVPGNLRGRAPASRGRGRRPVNMRNRRVHSPRRPRRFDAKSHERGARSRLRRYRQGSALAVALTAIILLLWGDLETQGQESSPPAQVTAVDSEASPALPTDPAMSLDEATRTIRDLIIGFYALLPKLLIAVLLLVVAWIASNAFRMLMHRTLRAWERSEAFTALGSILIYLLAIGAGLSVIAGDARALVGSVGLAGLALSWALQTPIESFTGWVMNSFRSYYKVGDRIEVGDVFGDVYKIDVLTTTVWEAGGLGKAVAGAQPTGAMITFPNWEVLRSNIINYSRDFPYVWDEVTFGVANESDLVYAIQTYERVAGEVIGQGMVQPVAQYQRLLERASLAFDVQPKPKVFVSMDDAWTNLTLRYLVPARERRRWASDLIVAITSESKKPEHAGRIIGSYPRTEVRLKDQWKPNPEESPDGQV